uniref:Venom Kazal domain peptide Pr14a n=1 Tax=Platymeris rhadamanthus TaxID=1134088 RepID=A0A6B9L6B5_PLARH|nr:venom Kazal domain peptide Pr14a [Platymeris rhadamanthus]
MKHFATVIALVFTILVSFSLMDSAEAQCPGFCPAVFQPVCGQRGNTFRTFGNSCELDRENRCTSPPWRLVKNGPC